MTDDIKKVYHNTREVAEALGISIWEVRILSRKLGIGYSKGKAKRMRFTDYDLMKLKNRQLCN